MNKILIIGAIIVLLIILTLVVGFGITGNVIVDRGSTTVISLSEISENAKWYEYDSNGLSIRFFVVRANDGSIKTGFDACDVCYGNKKGYSQSGDYMICNNCGNKYPIIGLGTENKNPGGCWPGYLPSSIEGDNLVIKNSDLEEGRWRFV